MTLEPVILVKEGETAVSASAEALTQAFFRGYPRDAARKLESLAPADAAHIFTSQPSALRQRVWADMTPPAASRSAPAIRRSG